MINFLKSLWWLIINIGYLIVILFLGGFLLTTNSQAQDFIYTFLQDPEKYYIISVALALVTWCYVCWYSAAIILQVDPLESALKRFNFPAHKWLVLNVPRLLGIAPCLVMLLAVLFVPSEDIIVTNQAYYTISLSVMAGLIYLSFLPLDGERKLAINSTTSNAYPDFKNGTLGWIPFVKYIYGIKPQYFWPTEKEMTVFRSKKFPTLKEQLIFLFSYSRVRFFYVFFGALSILLLVVFSITQLNIIISQIIKPASILIISLMYLTFLFTLVSYFHDYTNRPFAIILLIVVFAFSYFNDNTEPVYAKSIEPDPRLTLNQAFNTWVQTKYRAWKKTSKKPMPVIMIATQGGGIRGLVWTSRVIDSLNRRFPFFFDQTFVISGVSGGGVGATMYLTFQNDVQQGKLKATDINIFNQFTGKDFLTPLAASFSFGDSFQKLIPWSMSSFERSKELGRTWDYYYNDYLKTPSLGNSFLDMWYARKEFNNQLPSLILNGTLAETGQRVVTSNLKLSNEKWFAQDVDFFSCTNKDVSISTAALNCCRFPVITSGALLKDGKRKRGHIIDGGYRENTGLQTIYNVYSSVRDHFKGDSLQLIVIYLKNGMDELNTKAKALTGFHDLGTPLSGLFNINGTGMPSKGIVQFCQQSFGPHIFFEMDLEARYSHQVKLPLGWYMSERVSREINMRVNEIENFDWALMDELKKFR